MSTTNVHRVTATFPMPRTVAGLIAFTQSVLQRMTGNASFPAPSPALSAVAGALADLQSAQTAALTRARGTVTLRDEKRGALLRLLEQLLAYVQGVADAHVDQEASTIEAAGFAVRKRPTRAPRVFAGKPGPVSGTVKLVTAPAARRASYQWESSGDGGKTWVSAPATLQARTTVTGLTSGAAMQFRSRAVTKAGEGNWSGSVAVVVP